MPRSSTEVVKAFIAAINRRNPLEISALMTVENGRVRLWQVYADWSEGARIMKEDDETA